MASQKPAFYFLGMAEYQKKRIDVVFRQNDPNESWQMNEGYQLRQSKIALGLGGATGEGFARGVFIQHDLLPEEHNDFIFAILGHQLGFVGCVLVILAYGLFITPERAARLAFSRPTAAVQPGLLVAAGNPLGLHSLADVVGDARTRLCVLEQSVEQDMARRAGLPDSRLRTRTSAAGCLTELQQGAVQRVVRCRGAERLRES